MSRPRRAAAQAAVEAIRIEATDADAPLPAVGEDEDAYVDVPDVGSKRGRKSCNDEFYDALPDVRTKKQKQMDLPSNTITSALVHQPALFDRLPIELKRLILPYLDSDPYALIALQLSTKSWYLAITTGRNTDAEWQRRCISMGAGKRSSGCKTWRQSWIFMMKTRCIVCREPAGIALGAMVPADLGPEWIKVCEICRSSGDHPFICTTFLEGLGNADRESLPSQLRKSKGGWTREYLKSIVDSLVAQRKQERLEVVKKVVSGYEGNVDTLRDAVMLVEDKKSKSHLLTKLVQRLLQLPEPALQDYDSIVQHHHAMLQAQFDLDSSLSLLQPALDSRWRISSVAVFSGPQKEAGSSTWLQAIACKDISASDFVLFQVDRKSSLEKYPLGKFDKFRTKYQACQSKVVCNGKPLGCEHGLCKFHHGPLCKPIVAELVNKVTTFCQEEQYHRELENASKILDRAYADALKLDKAGARILSLLHELIDCKNDDQIQLAIILSRLDGVIDLQAHLDIARRCLGMEEDKVWHVNLDDEFKGCYSKSDKGKGVALPGDEQSCKRISLFPTSPISSWSASSFCLSRRSTRKSTPSRSQSRSAQPSYSAALPRSAARTAVAINTISNLARMILPRRRPRDRQIREMPTSEGRSQLERISSIGKRAFALCFVAIAKRYLLGHLYLYVFPL